MTHVVRISNVRGRASKRLGRCAASWWGRRRGAGHEALGDVLLRRFRHFVATTRDAHALVVAVHNLS